ncbi:ABC transporter ATP-binding protein [Streptomyces sp. SAS_272]|uniref:ABC transporter ATP-binding protein n=1 Tax=Streptomyces sp. SAS_272 TaxID=3412747 RepID=UPI00403C53C9
MSTSSDTRRTAPAAGTAAAGTAAAGTHSPDPTASGAEPAGPETDGKRADGRKADGKGADGTATGSPARGTRLTLRAAALGRPDAAALADVDLDVRPGEILTVVGPSGCGKSTLLRTFAGLLPALGGAVEQDGLPIGGPAADRALVFQEDALLPWRTLLANVELPLAIQGLRRAERRRKAADWLERVGLADRARQLPHRVSGGQRQRAQLARALATGPRAVLMDEPFGALDAQTRAGMQDLLVEVLQGTGATVVFVTHDVDEALFLGDRVALLGAGRLVAVRDVPRPRDRAAHDDPARAALRRDVLTSLST